MLLHRGSTYLIAKGLEYFDFLFLYLFLRELVMTNFVYDRLHQQRNHIFVFGGYEHAHNSQQVEVARLQLLVAVLEVSVHDVHCQEESLV